jgi:type IV secretion system protein VirB10
VTNTDDELEKGSEGTRHDSPHFRARESESEEIDEGMPPVNRKKKANKAVSAAILLLVLFVGLLLIVKLNSAPKVKKADSGKGVVSNNLPEIDTTPAPPPRVVPAPVTPPPINPDQAKNTGNEEANGYHPPQKGPGGKLLVHWTDRKLIGDLVVQAGGQQQGHQDGGSRRAEEGSEPGYEGAVQPTTMSGGGGLGSPRSNSNDNLGSRLNGTSTPSAKASLLRNRDFLLTKGTSLDCTMDVAIDTSLPGIISCTLNNDVYSDNNRTLLLERGTQMVGEQQGNVKQGQARIFALWTRAKTPNGVIININSPGADSLGRSGLDGWVDNHFRERFGAAILMTFIQSSLKFAVASQENNSPTTIVGDAADSGEGVVSKILDNTINIPPTILKNQGDHINIMVARDLDFSTVYGLEAQ